jgi:hypothetical protein
VAEHRAKPTGLQITWATAAPLQRGDVEAVPEKDFFLANRLGLWKSSLAVAADIREYAS